VFPIETVEYSMKRLKQMRIDKNLSTNESEAEVKFYRDKFEYTKK